MAVVTMAVVTMLWSNAKRGETGEREREDDYRGSTLARLEN